MFFGRTDVDLMPREKMNQKFVVNSVSGISVQQTHEDSEEAVTATRKNHRLIFIFSSSSSILLAFSTRRLSNESTTILPSLAATRSMPLRLVLYTLRIQPLSSV